MTDKEMLDAIKKMLNGESENTPPQKPKITTDTPITMTAADLIEFANSFNKPTPPLTDGDDDDGIAI